MYIRDTDIIILRPGARGAEHAGERFEAGGTVETDILPIGEELTLYRIIVKQSLPDTLLVGLAGAPVHSLMEIPPYRGFCPRRGNDHGGDALHLIRNARIRHARHVERGTLIAIEDEAEAVPTRR